MFRVESKYDEMGKFHQCKDHSANSIVRKYRTVQFEKTNLIAEKITGVFYLTFNK